MAITFQSVIENVRADCPVCTATDDDLMRYCRLAWHEIFHTNPRLRRVFDPATGAITEAPEDAPDTATEFPDVLDSRRIPIEALVRSYVTFKSKMEDAQVRRFKIDTDTFNQEQGIADRL